MNLLDMVKDQVSGSLISNASKFLGESESGVGKALDGIFPALMGKMIDKTDDGGGLDKLFDMAKGSDDSILDDIGGLFGGGAGNVAKLMNGGSGVLNLLLGNNTGGLIDKVAGFSGLKGSATSSLIKMAAPFLMSMVGRHIKNKALDAVGLGKWLGGQRGSVKSAMPGGLLSSLGAGFLGKGFDAITGLADNVGDAGKKVVGGAADVVTGAAGAVGDAGKKVVGGAADAVGAVGDAGKKVVGGAADLAGDVADVGKKAGGGLLKWLLPLVLILGGLGWWMSRGGSGTGIDVIDKAAEKTAEMAGDAAGAVGDAAGAVGDVAGDAVDAAAGALGSVFSTIDEAAKKTLDGITFAAGSAGSQMMDFIKGGFKGDGNFRFNNLTFDTGSAAISGETGAEVDNLAAILAAYPNVKVHVTGHTDNTGDAAKNMTLSQARANAVKGRLMGKGIAGTRITTKGMGDSDPAASNDTEEGRKQNRRIEVSIVK